VFEGVEFLNYEFLIIVDSKLILRVVITSW
jgi:hypothetical protein